MEVPFDELVGRRAGCQWSLGSRDRAPESASCEMASEEAQDERTLVPEAMERALPAGERNWSGTAMTIKPVRDRERLLGCTSLALMGASMPWIDGDARAQRNFVDPTSCGGRRVARSGDGFDSDSDCGVDACSDVVEIEAWDASSHVRRKHVRTSKLTPVRRKEALT